MLSYTCKIAIKAVVYLASKYESTQNAGVKEIAQFINASEHTVGKLLQTLVKQGFINSMKGPSGGFYISNEQRNQPLIRIIDAIDGKNVFRECGLALSKCSASHPCPIHNEYKKARSLIENLFNSKKIIDLCEIVNSGAAYLKG